MRTAVAAAIGAYIGLAAAALCTGIEFGIQPAFYHTADGKALYCPYGLNIAVPAMLLEHMLLFCWIEAVVTFLVIRYLQREDPLLLK